MKQEIVNTYTIPQGAIVSSITATIDSFVGGIVVEFTASYEASNGSWQDITLEETFYWRDYPELLALALGLESVTRPYAAQAIPSEHELRCWDVSFEWTEGGGISDVALPRIDFGLHGGEDNWSVALELGETPHLVEKELSALVKALIPRASASTTTLRATNCETCVGGCCSNYLDVGLVEIDVPGLLRATGATSVEELRRKGVIQGTGVFGYVGVLGRDKTPFKFAKVAGPSMCMFLRWDSNGVTKCSIYKDRPTVCRTFSEENCELHEAPSEELAPRLFQIRPFRPYSATDIRESFDYDHFSNTHYTEMDRHGG